MPARPIVRVYTDGGARGNPGPAAIGVVVSDSEDRVLREHAECFGVGTNNEAEYRALIKGLELAADVTTGEVECILDSELVARQMRGAYRVREPRMDALHRQAVAASLRFAKTTYRERPRLTGLLRRADELVNRALDEASRDYKSTGMGWPHEIR